MESREFIQPTPIEKHAKKGESFVAPKTLEAIRQGKDLSDVNEDLLKKTISQRDERVKETDTEFFKRVDRKGIDPTLVETGKQFEPDGVQGAEYQKAKAELERRNRIREEIEKLRSGQYEQDLEYVEKDLDRYQLLLNKYNNDQRERLTRTDVSDLEQMVGRVNKFLDKYNLDHGEGTLHTAKLEMTTDAMKSLVHLLWRARMFELNSQLPSDYPNLAMAA